MDPNHPSFGAGYGRKLSLGLHSGPMHFQLMAEAETLMEVPMSLPARPLNVMGSCVSGAFSIW